MACGCRLEHQLLEMTKGLEQAEQEEEQEGSRACLPVMQVRLHQEGFCMRTCGHACLCTRTNTHALALTHTHAVSPRLSCTGLLHAAPPGAGERAAHPHITMHTITYMPACLPACVPLGMFRACVYTLACMRMRPCMNVCARVPHPCTRAHNTTDPEAAAAAAVMHALPALSRCVHVCVCVTDPSADICPLCPA